MRVKTPFGWSKVGAALAAVAVLGLAGCHYAGGGTVTSATGSGEATFAFNLDCPTGSTVQSGVLTYIDPAAGVYIHAAPSGPPEGPLGPTTCGSNGEGYGDFHGTYYTLNGNHATGEFSLGVTPDNSGPPVGRHV